MPNHFDCLGFDVKNEDDYKILIRAVARKSEPLYTRAGGYLPWRSSNGIELWAQFDNDDRLVGLTPHFSGKTTQIVALSEKYFDLRYPLYGKFEAWINPEIDKTEDSPYASGDYPIIFESPAYDWFQNLTLPVIARVQLAAFAHNLEIFDTDENYRPVDYGVAQLAKEFFIPVGSFTEKKGEEPEAVAYFGGTVVSSRTLKNMITNKQFTLATVQTYCTDIDLVIAQELVPNPLTPGQIIRGTFWISGMIQEIVETFEPTEPLEHSLLFGQIEIVETQFQEGIEAVAKNLTFGDRVKLVREPGNPQDPNAVAVYTLDCVKLGYIPRSDNNALAEMIDYGIQPLANLVEKKVKPYTRLSIRVYFPVKK